MTYIKLFFLSLSPLLSFLSHAAANSEAWSNAATVPVLSATTTGPAANAATTDSPTAAAAARSWRDDPAVQETSGSGWRYEHPSSTIAIICANCV